MIKISLFEDYNYVVNVIYIIFITQNSDNHNTRVKIHLGNILSILQTRYI